MIITRLEEAEQSKIKVSIDGDYAFWLYQKDITNFGLSEGSEISNKLYDEIRNIMKRRAQEKALSILKFMDRTTEELRRKLREAGYSEDIAEEAIEYVSSYGYLNDERYAASYVRSKMNSKSQLVIRTGLLQKGVDRDIIDKVLKEEYGDGSIEDAEANAIQKAIAKKTNSPENLSYDEKQKMIASLYRKGFDINKIKQMLS